MTGEGYVCRQTPREATPLSETAVGAVLLLWTLVWVFDVGDFEGFAFGVSGVYVLMQGSYEGDRVRLSGLVWVDGSILGSGVMIILGLGLIQVTVCFEAWFV